MNHFVTKAKLLAGSLVLGFGLLASPVAVLAHQTTDDDNSSSGSSSGNQGSGSSGRNGSDDQDEHSAVTTAVDDKSADLRNRAHQLLDDKRAQVKQLTAAQRQQACRDRQEGINNRFSKLGSKAEAYLNRYDTTFAKVRAYQAQKQLNVANYDALLNDVLAKQSAATTAVSALKNLTGTKVDCTSADPASPVANVKTAASDAHTALQAYRTSLKALIQGMLDAKNTTTEGNN